MKTGQKLGFADFMVEKRKIKQEFFNQVNLMVDWRLVSNIINKSIIRKVIVQLDDLHMMDWFYLKYLYFKPVMD